MSIEIEEDEWPEFIIDEAKQHKEFGRISDALGELHSAILDCKKKRILDPSIRQNLSGFINCILNTLD